MAFVDAQTNQQDPNAPLNPAMAQPAPPTTSTGAGPAVSKTPTSNVSAQVAGTNSPPQPFQNISAYLTANAPQVQQEGQTVASGLNAQANAATGDVNKTAADFGAQVAGGTTTLTPEQVAKFETSPTTFAQNPSDVATFKALYNNVAPYTGPSDFTTAPTYSGLSTEAAHAAGVGASLKDFNGIQAYLQSLNPQSTAGTASLDTTLLEGTPSAVAPITGAAENLKAIPTSLANATATENAAVKAGQETAQQGATMAGNAATVTEKNLTDTLANELAAATATGQKGTETVKADFLGGKATPDELASLGMSPQDYATLMKDATALKTDYGTAPDLAPYLMAGAPGTEFAGKAATPQDYQTVAALEELLGNGYNAPLDVTQAGEAGTAPTNFLQVANNPLQDIGGSLASQDAAFIQNDLGPAPSLAPQGGNGGGNPAQLDPNYKGALPAPSQTPGGPGTPAQLAPVERSPENDVKAEIFARNPTLLNATQKAWLSAYQGIYKAS